MTNLHTGHNPPIILTDTGPLVGLFVPTDQHHNASQAVYQSTPVGALFLTTYPCLTEALHLIKQRQPNRQSPIVAMCKEGKIQIHLQTTDQVTRALEIITAYGPETDLADASLIATAETLNINQVFTFDSQFRKYQLKNGEYFTLIPQDTSP